MNAVYSKYLADGEETIKTRQVEWKSRGEKSENAEYGDRESGQHFAHAYYREELKAKGLVKLNNFKNNKNKIGYLYILTPKGISAKTKLSINFMKRKMKEYDELKAELENKNN